MVMNVIDSLHSKLAYHNKRHADIIEERALGIACKIANADINLDCIRIIARSHDICFGDPKAKQYKSQEHFTASVVKDILKSVGYSKEYIETVCSAIIATNPWVTPQTIEQKIIRAADLGGLMDYDTYREDFYKLMAEANEKDEKTHLLNSINFLTLYIWPTIQLTSDYYNEKGVSEWHSNTLSNIIQHYRELFDEPVTVEIGPGSNPCVLYDDVEGLVIGIEPDYMARKGAVSLLWGNNKKEIIAPGDGNLIPIKETVDSIKYYNVILRHIDALNMDEVLNLKAKELEVIEAYSPDLGHKNAQVAKEAIKQKVGKFDNVEDLSAANLPCADSDAFRLNFEIGNGTK